MKVERVLPGQYRIKLYNKIGVYAWIIREKRRWFWLLGDYNGYDRFFAWETGGEHGPFPSRRQTIADAIRELNL